MATFVREMEGSEGGRCGGSDLPALATVRQPSLSM